jgi:DNA-binding response OmpR family regulator
MGDSQENPESKKVLVADDSIDIRRMLQFHFEDEGWDFVEASDGAEAIESLLLEQPDLLVLDVMMPEINGWEVIKYVREKDMIANTPVLMLTGIGEGLNEMTSPLFGADAYLDKPVDLDELDEKIVEAIKSRKQKAKEASL